MSARARLMAILTTLLVALVGLGTSASAAPYSPAPSIGVGDANPCVQGPVHLTGVGYVPGSTEVLTIGDVVIRELQP